jgi:hypothetical protein
MLVRIRGVDGQIGFDLSHLTRGLCADGALPDHGFTGWVFSPLIDFTGWVIFLRVQLISSRVFSSRSCLLRSTNTYKTIFFE